jgi:hypothetical protein
MKRTVLSAMLLCLSASANAYVIESFPILERVEASGQALDPETVHWMKKWKGLDLEDPIHSFSDLGGSTSITLKIRKADPDKPDGKSMGSFVPRNGAGNPNTGTAYFNLAAILGYDGIFRPGVRYEAGPRATAALKSLIDRSTIKGQNRLENKTLILKNIAAGGPLKGYVKASSTKGAIALNAIVDPHGSSNGGPRLSHPVIASLQASNPKPKAGTSLTLAKGFTGDALQLAREYSVIMTLDAVLGQWDRYSGGNLAIRNDDKGVAHFYAVDNDGADIGSSTGWSQRDLSWFSRYDRRTIQRLKEIYAFLNNPQSGFLGYTNAETFVVDLGLYFEIPTAVYLERLKRNLKLTLDRVAAVEAKYGDAAYLD